MLIVNGSSIPLNQNSGTLPQLDSAILDWFQPMTYTTVAKTVNGGVVNEVGTSYSFQGVIMPLNARQLYLKPEGERAWSWYNLFSQTPLELQVDDVINFQSVQYRVMARFEYGLYGIYNYQLVQDWTGAGPA